MTWWQRAPAAGQIHAAAEAAALAFTLINRGVDDAAVLAQLRTVRGGRRALQAAADVVVQHSDGGYPQTRMHRLLRAAADDPVQAPTAEQAAVEARQRQFWEQPVEDSFRRLGEQVPGLRELEQRARDHPESFLRELTTRAAGPIGGPPPRNPADRTPADRQARLVMGIDTAVKRLLGPASGLSDPVLGSAAAARAACSHLRQVAGMRPPSGGTSAG